MIGNERQVRSRKGARTWDRRFLPVSRAPFVFFTGILFIALLGLGTLADDILTIDGHTFEFLGVSYNDDGTSSWAYRVASGERPSLSHWVIELDPAITGENVVGATEGYEVGKDPTTGIYGIKFDKRYKDGEERGVEFILDGWYQAGNTRIAIKAGNDVQIGEPFTGPTSRVEGGNAPPIANDDEASTYEGKYIKIAVLANDEDPDGDPLELIEITQPENGATKITGKKVRYIPDKGFVGTDTFTYTISDGNGGVASATVTVTVERVNARPKAENDEATTRENRAVEIDILANDTDSDGTIDPTSVSIVKEPRHGSVVVDPATGTTTYIPDPDRCGSDYFQYTVVDNDGAVSNKAKVTIRVACNEPPVALDDEATTEAGSPVNIDVAANDSDSDGAINRASVVIVKDPKHGTVNVNPTTGVVTYTPASCGSDYFQYTIEDDDGAVSNRARVTVTIVCNEPPIAHDDTASTDENASIGINVLANDEDRDGRIDPTTVTIVDPPEGGTVSVHPRTGVITYTPEPRRCGEDRFSYTVADDDGAISNEAKVTVLVICAPPPVASDDLYTAPEGGRIDIDAPGVLANDRHAPMTELTAILVEDVEHGRLTLNPDGSFVYVHDGTETNEALFRYKANDGINDSNVATVRIAITPTNDPPTANDDRGETDEDTPVRIDVLANDIDPDGDRLSVDSVGDPENGTAVNNGREIVYTPDPDFNGTDQFTYTVSDGNGGSDRGTVVITVISLNDPPFARDDTAGTDEDTPMRIDVLANDSDPDGDPLTIQSVNQPENGWVDSDGGALTYTPDADYNGIDQFTYTVSDGNGGTATATVTVSVAAVNDPPLAQDDTATTDEDTLIVIAVLENDTDPDGDSLTIQSVNQPENGSVINDGTDLTYTPDPDFNGTDRFTYTVSDGNGGTATATVTVSVAWVNDPPLAQDDTSGTDEDTSVKIDVLANDSDPDGDPLTIQSVNQPENGSVINNGTDLTYTPDPDFNGIDRFTYTVSDGNGGTATATVTVSVAVVNDPPLAQDDTSGTDEDTPLVIQVLGNDSDPDGDPLTIESVKQPENGAVINNGTELTYTPDPDFNGIDRFTYTVSDGNGGTATATVTVSVAAVNDPPLAQDDTSGTDEDASVVIAVLENDSDPDGDPLTIQSIEQPENGAVINDGTDLTYTPDPDFNGIDRFAYTVSDGNGGTATATVTVAVAVVNESPLAQDDSAATGEDMPVTVPVLDNDSDPDGDPLTIESLTQPLNGSAVRSGEAIIYTPDPDFNGTDQFTYTVSDGNGGTDSAKVEIAIVAINDPPVGRDDTTATIEDTPIAIDVLVNDSDADGDPLIVGSVTQPASGAVINNGTELIYTPDPDFNGLDRFTYSVTDGSGGTDTATVTISVAATNDPPIAQDDSAVTDEGTLVTIPVLDNDSDPDRDFLLIESISQPEHGSVLNAKTAISYIPDAGFSGIDTFTYVVSDGNGGTARATVTVSVAAVNDPPLAQGDGAVTDEGTPVTIPVLSNDSDPDGDRLSVESVGAPENGAASSDGTDVIYTPDAGFSGVDTFSYTISDGRGGTATAEVVVAVAAVNGPPTAQDDSTTTGAGVPLTIDSLANDTDPDGDPLTIASFTQPANGTVTVDGGVFTYTPADGFAGTDQFTYTISDGNGGTDTAAVTIGVTPAIGGGGGTSGSAACEGRVIINEIAWAGTAADPRDEWIELRNLGTSPVDLTGWTIRWRRTRPTSPEEQEWKVLELSGIIPGAAVPACADDGADTASTVRFFKEDPRGIQWLVTSEPEEESSGYYTIERRDDKTVQDVKAGLLYDTSRTLALDLSDRGEVIALFDANGNLVDTANASYLGRDGWAAGRASTFATMERTDPLGPDTADNWHTNTGIVTRGTDEKGRPVTGTAGASNSPALEALEGVIGIEPAAVRAGETVEVAFPLPRQERKETGWPWVNVDRPGFEEHAGAGGALDMSVYAFSGRYEDGDTYVLGIDTSNLAPGRHIFWIVFGQGKALLVPIVVTP